MSVYTIIVDRGEGGKEAIPLFAVVKVTMNAGQTSASAAHGMGKTPVAVGRPNPDSNEGYNVRGSADATNVTITSDAPMSQNVTFTVVCYGI